MTIRALVIGIGSGDPDHLTREAVAALNRVDVFVVADKGAAKRDLVSLREEICRTLIAHDHYRFVEVPDSGAGTRSEIAALRTIGLAWRRGMRPELSDMPRSSVPRSVMGARSVSWSGAIRPSTTPRSASSSRSLIWS